MCKFLFLPFVVSLPLLAIADDGDFESRIKALPVEELTPRNPVSVSAILEKSSMASGDTAQVAIKTTVMPNWHIYAYDPTQVFKVTTYSVTLPEGMEEAGEWQLPSAEPYSADPNILVYHDELIFQQTLKAGADMAPGNYPVTVNFNYQACDPYICLPPKKKKVVLDIEVK
ncbi:protein-disulfide reductase DsbD family protein [Porticoccus sp. W117]|uniref:protein-disulfide reductase DsbD domain-containing protein n=1 Tax=Porticoccus sp. W117 TaxID=3054777 RepID=UPI0025920A5D|nr:protein-disulfide reductase DsbD domain-containing protein [Porticoccus sp. W117]MDM3870967.1 protein-disulfide reductase DsbD family protein [Porticoccus sp. W117]